MQASAEAGREVKRRRPGSPGAHRLPRRPRGGIRHPGPSPRRSRAHPVPAPAALPTRRPLPGRGRAVQPQQGRRGSARRGLPPLRGGHRRPGRQGRTVRLLRRPGQRTGPVVRGRRPVGHRLHDLDEDGRLRRGARALRHHHDGRLRVPAPPPGQPGPARAAQPDLPCRRGQPRGAGARQVLQRLDRDGGDCGQHAGHGGRRGAGRPGCPVRPAGHRRLRHGARHPLRGLLRPGWRELGRHRGAQLPGERGAAGDGPLRRRHRAGVGRAAGPEGPHGLLPLQPAGAAGRRLPASRRRSAHRLLPRAAPQLQRHGPRHALRALAEPLAPGEEGPRRGRQRPGRAHRVLAREHRAGAVPRCPDRGRPALERGLRAGRVLQRRRRRAAARRRGGARPPPPPPTGTPRTPATTPFAGSSPTTPASPSARATTTPAPARSSTRTSASATA